MTTQMGSTTRNRRRLDQIAILNARQSYLPQMIMNQQRAQDLARAKELDALQAQQFEREFAQDQERIAFEKKSYRQQKHASDRAARVGMGLEAAKLGMNLGTTYGGSTVGGFGGSVDKMLGTGFEASMSPMLSELSIGSGIGGALTGFGVSQLMGKKKKNKGAKIAAGIGAGALLGGLSGGLGGAISGGIGGGFGGGFGGFF